MFETVVLATDGSASAERSVTVALDLARRFEATIHALYVVDIDEVESSPQRVREDLRSALEESGEAALSDIQQRAEQDIETTVRQGAPTDEIITYARKQDADLIVTGTRGRHGEHAFLLGSVAESVVRRSPVPVLTVRQLEEGERDDIMSVGTME